MTKTRPIKKTRLDILLVQRSFAQNRDEAQRLIRAGKVLVRETVIDKPGTKIPDEAEIRVAKRETSYAGRGGLKLEAAIERFGMDVSGAVAVDLGASTGGFTDCLLRYGAKKVYAVDVGLGQLAYALQIDPRVVVLDKTNCRYLQVDDLGEPVDVVVGDLSFISIRTVFPAISRILQPEGFAILLIKPQFEIGKGRVGKKGIVRNAEDHLDVLQTLWDFFIQAGWGIRAAVPSPIQGKSGNIEFLVHVTAGNETEPIALETLQTVVEEAHAAKSNAPK